MNLTSIATDVGSTSICDGAILKLIFNSQVMCSFLQVYQEKVYDLLNPRFIVDLPVREHPKKGMRVFLLVQSCLSLASSILGGLLLIPPAD